MIPFPAVIASAVPGPLPDLLPPVADGDPPPFPALTARNAAHWLDTARTMIAGAAIGGAAGRKTAHRIVVDGMAHLKGLAELLVGETTTLDDWFRAMLADLVPRHLAAATAMTGDTEPDDETTAFLARQVDRQAGFLVRFHGQIADATQLLNGQVPNRAEQYGRAVWATGVNTLRWKTAAGLMIAGHAAAQLVASQLMERGVLGVADHCSDCTDRAGRGWVPIGTLPPIGASKCGPFCHCHFEYESRTAINKPTRAATGRAPQFQGNAFDG